MFLNGGGYSELQYNPARLRETARSIAAVLPPLMRRTNADGVAVTGKSGIALAFATSMLIDFPLIVVRKRGEYSHGNLIEGADDVDFKRYLILDDFISSGNTVKSIIDSIAERARQQDRYVSDSVRCVGVLEYNKPRPQPNLEVTLQDGTSTILPCYGLTLGDL